MSIRTGGRTLNAFGRTVFLRIAIGQLQELYTMSIRRTSTKDTIKVTAVIIYPSVSINYVKIYIDLKILIEDKGPAEILQQTTFVEF